MVLHERSLESLEPSAFCPTPRSPVALYTIYTRRWISDSSRFILYALANSSWILMTTLYRLLLPRIKLLSTCYSKGIAFYRCTDGGYAYVLYRVSILFRGISFSSSLHFNWALQRNEILRNKNDTRRCARDNYGGFPGFSDPLFNILAAVGPP